MPHNTHTSRTVARDRALELQLRQRIALQRGLKLELVVHQSRVKLAHFKQKCLFLFSYLFGFLTGGIFVRRINARGSVRTCVRGATTRH